ncbi:alpha-L-fucosidase [Anoplophora glabripennis]|uniref:alpha-L-fucosidase n=1 Tax=Anoplophora glabripennis TaxID=217634 RepID=UPI00087568AD|nr:alpha-L-fucosidase [Anoplophora glabripennis]
MCVVNMAGLRTVALLLTLTASVLSSTVFTQDDETKYSPTWDSLDDRPLPSWYDEAKFGIFIHWGVFSVPSFGSEWFWSQWKNNNKKYVDYMEKNYAPGFTYQEFAKDFRAELFDATEWANLFKKSGAKYVVLTSKHHEGYTLWPSNYAYSWNSRDIGPHRDLLGELAEAVRANNLTFGVYHSLLEWFHPVYVSDKSSGYTKQEFVDNKIIPEMKELVNTYKPDILWSDGDWEAPDFYWKSTEFLAWLYNESPVKDTVVVNDRWGVGTPCQHGGFYSCSDRYNPGTLQVHKWENAMTIDAASWGYRREAKLSEYLSTLDLISQLASTVSCGGNLLVNIGPTKDGTIIPIFEERLTQMGQWLEINGEAIYGTSPWTYQNDSVTKGVWYTKKDSAVYAIVLHWTWSGDNMVLASPLELFQDAATTVTLLGNEDDGNLPWTVDDTYVTITFPDKATAKSEWAWVLKIEPKSANNEL